MGLSTNSLLYEASVPSLRISNGGTGDLTLTAKLKNGGAIRHIFSFNGDNYRLGFRTESEGIRLDDDRLKPFFKKVSRLELPVVVHPPTKEKGLWGGTKYRMDGSVSREYEIIKCFLEVLNGVLPEFQNLNFVFAHYGGGVPSLMGRIMSWYTPERSGIPRDKIGFPKTIKEFEDYGLKKEFIKLFDQIYFNMAGTGGWIPAVKQALLAIKADRLCFATDYPWEMSRPGDLKSYINGIKRLNIPEKSKAKILGENIRRLFRA